MTTIMYIVKGTHGGIILRVSREQVTENRRTILEAAGRLFKERGFETVTVAEIMKAAGLTHGGFYGYFTSKDELIAEALADAMTRTTTGPLGDLVTYAKNYLTPILRDDRARGCPTAAFAAEAIRQTGSARAEMTTGIKQQIERFSRVASGETSAEKRRTAIGSWAAMVGAMILARASDDPALADEVLDQTRVWLEARAEDHGPRKSRSKRHAV
jgi:TetR/AcrR family transcriptional regulator, transcriptional repressor for nem operon